MMIERRKVPDKQFFRRLGLLITSAIRHRLSAAGLIKWVHDIYLKFLQKLQSGDADFRIEKVNITGDHQSKLAWSFSSRRRTRKRCRVQPHVCTMSDEGSWRFRKRARLAN